MKLVDRCLLYYSVIFTCLLSLGAMLSGFALGNLVITLLFLPVSFYFAYHLIRAISLKQLHRDYLRLTNPAALETQKQPHLNGATFKLEPFLTQKNPVFMITLGLFCLILITVVFKASLTYFPQEKFISPLPTPETYSGQAK